MVLCSSCDELVSAIEEAIRHGLCVLEGLVCIVEKGWTLSFFKCYSDCCDGMHMWTSLHTWENCAVDQGWNVSKREFWLFEWISRDSFAEDEGASWPAERFVCGGHHCLKSVIKRIFEESGCDKSCDMRDVGVGYGSDFLGYLDKFGIIEFSRIG